LRTTKNHVGTESTPRAAVTKRTELTHAATGGGYQPLCCSPWRDGRDSELQRGQTRANREVARNPEGDAISGQEHSTKAAALRETTETLALLQQHRAEAARFVRTRKSHGGALREKRQHRRRRACGIREPLTLVRPRREPTPDGGGARQRLRENTRPERNSQPTRKP
jgi:hypothetical protein